MSKCLRCYYLLFGKSVDRDLKHSLACGECKAEGKS